MTGDALTEVTVVLSECSAHLVIEQNPVTGIVSGLVCFGRRCECRFPRSPEHAVRHNPYADGL